MNGCCDCGESSNSICLSCLHTRIEQELETLKAQLALHKQLLISYIRSHRREFDYDPSNQSAEGIYYQLLKDHT